MLQNYVVGSAIAHLSYLGLQAFHTFFPHQSPTISSSKAYSSQIKELNKAAKEVARDVGFSQPDNVKVVQSKNEVFAFHSHGYSSSGVISVSASILKEMSPIPIKCDESLPSEKAYKELTKNCPLNSGEVSGYLKKVDPKVKAKIRENIAPLHSKLTKDEVRAALGHEIQHLCDNVCVKQLKNSFVASILSILGSAVVLNNRGSLPQALLFQASTYLIIRFALQFMNKEFEQRADQTAKEISPKGAEGLAKRELILRELLSDMPKSLTQKIQFYLFNFFESCSYEGVAERYVHLNQDA